MLTLPKTGRKRRKKRIYLPDFCQVFSDVEIFHLKVNSSANYIVGELALGGESRERRQKKGESSVNRSVEQSLTPMKSGVHPGALHKCSQEVGGRGARNNLVTQALFLLYTSLAVDT